MTPTPAGARPIPVAYIAAFAFGMVGFGVLFAASSISGSSVTGRVELGEAPSWGNLMMGCAVACLAAMIARWIAHDDRRAAFGCAIVALFGYFSAMYLLGFAI